MSCPTVIKQYDQLLYRGTYLHEESVCIFSTSSIITNITYSLQKYFVIFISFSTHHIAQKGMKTSHLSTKVFMTILTRKEIVKWEAHSQTFKELQRNQMVVIT